MHEEILDLLHRNLQAIWDGDAAAFDALCAPDVSFFEWYISTQRIDGVDFHLREILVHAQALGGGDDSHTEHEILQPRVQVVHLQHLDVAAQLAVVHGEVGVHVEHTRVGMAKKADPAIAQCTHSSGGADPFANLAPGAYRFEAIATSSAGLESPTAAVVRFQLVPPFYRAFWFKLMLGLLAAGLALLGWLAYRRRLQSRERALEQQIQRRTAELDRANERLRSANRALVEESHTDALTGLRNRRFLAHYMADWRRSGAQARSQRLAFVLIDLDHFKRVNDLHGHLAGDEVLRQLAAVLVDYAGSDGYPLRWGGEEFMLLMPAEAIADAALFCENLRLRISEKELRHSGDRVSRVTASIGYALFPALADQSDADDWNLSLELADAGLYLIKSSGRNGWAIVHARAHARVADFGAGFSGRLRELATAGLVLLETSPRRTRSGDGG